MEVIISAVALSKFCYYDTVHSDYQKLTLLQKWGRGENDSKSKNDQRVKGCFSM